MNKKKNDTISDPDFDKPGRIELKEEKKAAKEIKKETKTELKEAKTIIHILAMILRRLRREVLDVETREEFATAIKKIINAEHTIEQEISAQKGRFEKLESSSDHDIQKEVQSLEKLQVKAIADVKDFRYKLNEGISALQISDKANASFHLSKAKDIETDLKKQLKRLKAEENRIIGLIKKDEKTV